MYNYDDNNHMEENKIDDNKTNLSENSQEIRSAWSEPEYESAANIDARDVYSPSHHTQADAYAVPEMSEKPKKEKRRHGFLRAACLVLACIVLSGTTCYFVADYVTDQRMDEIQENATNQVVLGSTNRADTDSNSSGTQVAYTGDTLTSDQIYALACKQVVGVNTSLNTTNLFGQTTSNAVSGSGFVISSDGYIMTNCHVISYAINYGGELSVKLYDGTSYEAEIVGYNEDNDVAVLKIDATGLSPVTIGDSDDMIVGETVYAVGNPLGELTYTMTGGMVSALDRVITTSDSTTGSSSSINMFQIDAAVNSGNSGGPVYNSRGEVIGIVTAKYSSSGVEGLGFAIPVNDAMDIATQLIERGYVTGAYLGVEVADVTSVYSDFTIQYYGYPKGVYLMKVNDGSCAETGGLQIGDIITKVGDTEITSTDELKLALKKYNPGDTGVLTIYRAGATLGSGDYKEITVAFDESEPAAESDTQTRQEIQSVPNGQPGGGFPMG